MRLCSMTSLFFHLFLLLLELLRLLLRVDLSDRDAGGLPLLDGLAGAGQLDTYQDTTVPHVPRQEGLGGRERGTLEENNISQVLIVSVN